jgi:hypothetical protein
MEQKLPEGEFWTCRICRGPAKRPILFDVVKNITSQGESQVRYYICGDCDEKRRKRPIVSNNP